MGSLDVPPLPEQPLPLPPVLLSLLLLVLFVPSIHRLLYTIAQRPHASQRRRILLYGRVGFVIISTILIPNKIKNVLFFILLTFLYSLVP